MANELQPRRNPKQRAFATRRRILEILKRDGGRDAESMGRELGFTAMAVRQHLYQMEEEGWVDTVEEPIGRGRPKRVWSLTPNANQFFPDRHNELLVSLLNSVQSAFGAEGVDKLLDDRAQRQYETYRASIPANLTVEKRVETLATLRSREGYMAEARREADGIFLLIENHCPICEAAAACQGFCEYELELFQRILGEDVSVERTEHLMDGQRRCVYRITIM